VCHNIVLYQASRLRSSADNDATANIGMNGISLNSTAGFDDISDLNTVSIIFLDGVPADNGIGIQTRNKDARSVILDCILTDGWESYIRRIADRNLDSKAGMSSNGVPVQKDLGACVDRYSNLPVPAGPDDVIKYPRCRSSYCNYARLIVKQRKIIGDY